MNTQHSKWEPIFILPNLGISEAIGNDYIAIVTNIDKRVVDFCSSNKLAKSLVENFEDQFRRKKDPSLLIINDNSTSAIQGIDAVIGFRNIFALTCIIKSHEFRNPSISSIILPGYSDYFDFYPITISRTNDGYLTNSPALLKFDDSKQNFRGQTSPALANQGQIKASPDRQLFVMLEDIWKRRFVKRKLNEWKTRALFRSS